MLNQHKRKLEHIQQVSAYCLNGPEIPGNPDNPELLNALPLFQTGVGTLTEKFMTAHAVLAMTFLYFLKFKKTNLLSRRPKRFRTPREKS